MSNRMRAIMVEEPGDVTALRMENVPEPEPAPDEVLIDVHYAACNWMDIEKRRGVYPDPSITYPTCLGNEVSGRIKAIGSEVGDLAVGQRVAAIVRGGGYAERCVASARLVIPLPGQISDELGAAFPVVSLTAYHLLHTAHRLTANESILVHAIGGGVGLMLTQIARLIGATVFGTVGHAGKGDRAIGFGAKRVIDRSEEDFVEIVLAETNARGVDLVIDSLGGETGYRSFDALRLYGRLINIGEAEDWPKENLRDKLYERSTSFAGYETIHALQIPGAWQESVAYLVDAFSAGALQLPVARTYDFEQSQQMHSDLEGRLVSGKLLLRMKTGASDAG